MDFMKMAIFSINKRKLNCEEFIRLLEKMLLIGAAKIRIKLKCYQIIGLYAQKNPFQLNEKDF